jgi:mutator protein MutT
MRIAIGILRKDGRLLIAQRMPHREYGEKWEFPGGKVEAGESVVQALRREIYEELGVTLLQAHHLVDLPFPADTSVTLCFYVIDWFDGVPALKDHLALAWVKPEHIANYGNLLINTPMLDVLGYLESYDAAAKERGERAMQS